MTLSELSTELVVESVLTLLFLVYVVNGLLLSTLALSVVFTTVIVCVCVPELIETSPTESIFFQYPDLTTLQSP